MVWEILACAAASKMPDGTEMPYVPRDPYELDWAQTDWTYTCVGPVRAGAWGALDPHD